MAINLVDGFNVTVSKPLDERTIAADLTARDAIPLGVRYEGLAVYVVSEQKVFRLKGGVENAFWMVDDSGGGGGGFDPTVHINYIFGDGVTDGSIRINTGNGDFTIEKRVAGVWTFLGSFSL